ncbi:hypothetical protein TrST_g9854 [Triparma strigata]|uniref:Glycoside hydrolase family 79 protein n=1 Tax=Triparma strigata TaxID=1606541 RepID=A0A9W7EBF2_9STRA|nr:hypothetical protein TrST_g9854 [Triparma strigata]
MHTSTLTLTLTSLLLASQNLIIVHSSNTPISISADPTSNPIALTSQTSFGCLALDWWPASKCDYDWCPWAVSSFLEVDLTSKVLKKAISTLAPEDTNVFLRLGGSLCDFVRYDFPGSHDDECRDFSDPTNSTRVGYELGSGCLKTDRWDELNHFCADIPGCTLIFGINALIGRENSTCPADTDCHWDSADNACCTEWSGNWNSSNAEALLRYTEAQGYDIYAFEFGNELTGKGGIQAQLDADTYSTDFCALKNLIDDIWTSSSSSAKPKVVGPDNSYDGDDDWFGNFTALSFEKCGGPDVVTWHQYLLGAGVDSAADEKSRDPNVLDEQIKNGKNLKKIIYDNTPEGSTPPEIWMGEAGGAYNSGRPGVTDAFTSSFWYLDGFGILSENSEQTFCRQTLVGGNYGLLQNTEQKDPNPDFFALALWQNLMGKNVMEVTRSDAAADRYIRSYAHQSDSKDQLTFLLINLNNETAYDVNLSAPGMSRFEDFTVTSESLDSQVVFLNGVELKLNDEGDFPNVATLGVEAADGPLTLQPLTYGFYTFKK